MKQWFVSGAALTLALTAHAYGESSSEAGGGDAPTVEAVMATTSISPEVLKGLRGELYAQAIKSILANNAVADAPECDGNEKWFQTTCVAKPPAPQAAVAPQAASGGRKYALLIANYVYRSPIPSLISPARDSYALADVLRDKFGYETTLVTNPTKSATLAALKKLAAQATAADSVIVFYAGHGYYLDAVGKGFWIPPDASPHAAAGWISNSDISKVLASTPSKQVLLISDSCYSGSLTAEQKIVKETDLAPEQILRQRSVVAFSSGGNEPVADEGKDGHSVFAWNLLDALRAAPTLEKGINLWSRVKTGVMKTYPQEPQYGALLSAGHMAGGDYLVSGKK